MKILTKALFACTLFMASLSQATNTFNYVDHYIKGEQAILDANDLAGYSVAISGDIMVVGVPWDSSNGGGSGVSVHTSPFAAAQDNSSYHAGAAYVFERDTVGVWQMTAYFKAHNPGNNDEFGRQVAIDGNTIVVTAKYESSSVNAVTNLDNPLILTPPTDNDDTSSSGAAYVYVRNNAGQWRLQSYLKADLGSSQWLGESAAIDGDRIVLGARNNAVVFERSSFSNPPPLTSAYAGWVQTATLSGSQSENGDRFGAAVDLDGDVLAVGAPNEEAETPDPMDSGAAYVFYYDGTNWIEQARVRAAQRSQLDNFGNSIAIDGGRLAVGAPQEDGGGYSPESESAGQSGAVYLYTVLGSGSSATWVPNVPTHYLKAPVVSYDDYFGGSVALDNGILVVGAGSEDGDGSSPHNYNVSGYSGTGAVYVFEQAFQGGGFDWINRAYLKSPNIDQYDVFGATVDIDDGDIVIGAPFEDGNNRNNPANNDLSTAGAAYYFGFDNATTVLSGFYLIGGGLVNVPISGIGISNEGNYITVRGYAGGRFVFPSPVNGAYNVQIDDSTVPSDLTCWVQNGSGSTVGVGEVYDIWIICGDKGPIFSDSFETINN